MKKNLQLYILLAFIGASIAAFAFSSLILTMLTIKKIDIRAATCQ
ncbi:hypothetical protein AB9M62_13735 [Bacillales bacterium AN1005]